MQEVQHAYHTNALLVKILLSQVRRRHLSQSAHTSLGHTVMSVSIMRSPTADEPFHGTNTHTQLGTANCHTTPANLVLLLISEVLACLPVACCCMLPVQAQTQGLELHVDTNALENEFLLRQIAHSEQTALSRPASDFVRRNAQLSKLGSVATVSVVGVGGERLVCRVVQLGGDGCVEALGVWEGTQGL